MKFAIILLSLTAVLVVSTYAQSSENEAQTSLRSLISSTQILGFRLKASVDSTSNRYKKVYLRNANAQLPAVISSARALLTNVRNARNNWEDQIADQEATVVLSWNILANQTISHVADNTNNNNDAVEKAQQVTDQFVAQYTTSLKTCANNALGELTNFETSVQKSVKVVQAAVQSLSNAAANCVNSANTLTAIRQCQSTLLTAFANLRQSTAAMTNLNPQAVRLSRARYAQNSCVTQTVGQFQREISDVQNRVNEIITDSNAATTVATTTDSSSVSTDGSSTDPSSVSTDSTATTSVEGSTQSSATDPSSVSTDTTASTSVDDSTQSSATDSSSVSTDTTASTSVDDSTQSSATDSSSVSTDTTVSTSVDDSTQSSATDSSSVSTDTTASTASDDSI